MTTNKNYSGLVYYVYMLPIFLSQSYAFRKDINFKHNYVTHYLVYFVLFILIFNYTISPKPYFDAVDRIRYWNSSSLPFLSQIFGSMASFIPFYFGILLRIGYKKTSIVSFLIYIIYIILIGQKGGSLIQSLIFYIFPYSLKYIRKKEIFKILPYLSFAFIIMLIIAYISYSSFNPYSYLGFDPIQGLAYRVFGLQNGLTWYATEYYLFKFGTFNPNDIFDGMTSMMNDVLGTSMIDRNYTSLEGRFTNAFPANVIKFNWFLGYLITLFVAYILFLIIRLWYYIFNKSFLFGILSFNAITVIQNNIAMGDFGLAIKWIFLTLLMWIILEFIKEMKKI